MDKVYVILGCIFFLSLVGCYYEIKNAREVDYD